MSKQHSIQREEFLSFTPSLACHIGVNAAVVVQKIQFLCNCPNSGLVINGQRWVWNSLPNWQKNFFPFWTVATIRRIFDDLESAGVLVTCQPAGVNRTKHYRISQGAFEKMTTEAAVAFSSAQIEHMDIKSEQMHPLKLSTCYKTESTSESSSESKGGSSDPTTCGFNDRNRRPLPESEGEMYDLLEQNGIDINPDRDGQFFDQMEKSGWTIRGKKVADWMEAYKGRVEHTGPKNIKNYW